ncbi:MAG: hypothetical protein AAB917_00030 [Patescibacteria group bacterium]
MLSNKLKKYSQPFLCYRRVLGQLLLLTFLLAAEFSVMPLTFGPDRRIHDPAVYRLQDSTYLQGDWYTGMAVESGVYTFYSALIHASSFLGIGEELWRMLLYISCMVGLYVYLLKLARLFTSSWLVVPLVVVLHTLLVTANPPLWLYGYYIQVDGGLAPRSVAMAFSIAALYYLLKAPRYLPWILLGLSTLAHVSHSFITFVLFLGAWFSYRLFTEFQKSKSFELNVYWPAIKESFSASFLYLIAGGWFLLQVFWLSLSQTSTFSAQKFIWAWVYFRAPYMALPTVPEGYWFILAFHVAALFCGGWLVRRWYAKQRAFVDLLLFVGLFALGGFGVFYLFAFMVPWVPGFQFYSLRLVYFTYLIGHLFMVLFLMSLVKKLWQTKSLTSLNISERIASGFLLLFLGGALWLCPVFPGTKFVIGAPGNLEKSWEQILKPGAALPESVTGLYLAKHPEPFLAPPDWNGTRTYLPTVASFKTFGFTPEGLEEWYERMDTLSRGELQKAYEKQSKKEKYKPVYINWKQAYETLTTQEVEELSKKYNFNLFLTYREKEYPFELLVEDEGYRLYRLDTNGALPRK